MIKQVIAWAFVAVFATVVVTDAYALTLRSGEVLTDNGVVHASESATTRTMIERDGYAVAGGQVHIAAGESVVSIDLSDIAGKGRDRVREIIGEEVTRTFVENELTDRLGDTVAEADVASLVESIETNGIIDEAILNDLSDEAADAVAAAYNAAADIAGQAAAEALADLDEDAFTNDEVASLESILEDMGTSIEYATDEQFAAAQAQL